MKTASVREVQHGLSALLKRVQRGDEIVITRRGRVIARLLPAPGLADEAEWPDFEARASKLRISGKPASAIIEELRGERL